MNVLFLSGNTFGNYNFAVLEAADTALISITNITSSKISLWALVNAIPKMSKHQTEEGATNIHLAHSVSYCSVTCPRMLALEPIQIRIFLLKYLLLPRYHLVQHNL